MHHSRGNSAVHRRLTLEAAWPPLVLNALYLALFWLLFRESHGYLFALWNGGEYAYCYLVLAVALYLAWSSRASLRREPSRPSWWGGVALGLGALCYLLGELGGEYYTLYLSSWLMLLGLFWLHLGWRKLRIIAFPLGLGLALFPFPRVVDNNLSLKLKLVSSELGCRMLQWAGVSAFREGNVIDLGATRLEVVDACSGLRYLVPLLILGLLLARQLPPPFWRRALLVLSVLPLSVLANALRLASVGALYPVFGAAAAEGAIHDFSGWLIFMVTLAALVGETRLLRTLPGGAPGPPAPGAHPGASLPLQGGGQEGDGGALAPGGAPPPWAKAGAALALMAGMLALLGTVEFRERVPLARPLFAFPETIGEWRGNRLTMERAQLEALKLSDYLLADYHSGRLGSVNLYVAYQESQRKRESSHSPSSCLPGSGWVIESAGLATLPVGPGGEPCRVQRALVTRSGEKLLVYYWFPQRGRVLTSMLQLKLYAFWDALTRHRTDGALVRLITPLAGGEALELPERRVAEFARQAMPVLGTFLPGS